MMQALRTHRIVEKDGEIYLTGLPCKKGQKVETIVLVETKSEINRPLLTARHLLNSGIIGLWKDRTDIGDSVTYAQYLRQQAEHREKE
ncbi:MAG: hypothetical protein AAB110_04045 [Candidatus Desantisbacteria bacterium]